MSFEKDVLTTGEVARICNVAPRTVSKWFDSGSLKGYRIPGSKDRRIPIRELMAFMKAHNIPMDGLASGQTRVLVVDDDKEVIDVLTRVLAEQTNYEVRAATTAFEAGLAAHSFRPHVLLLDLHLGDGDASQVVKVLQSSEDLQITRVIAMSGKLTDGQAHALHGQGFESFLRKPFQVRTVVEAIEAATNVVQ